jgi:hypothetical protein
MSCKTPLCEHGATDRKICHSLYLVLEIDDIITLNEKINSKENWIQERSLVFISYIPAVYFMMVSII